MVMTVNSEKTSLSITEVNYTDSGLYYCCIQRMNYITFSNATFLLVRGNFILQATLNNISIALIFVLFSL